MNSLGQIIPAAHNRGDVAMKRSKARPVNPVLGQRVRQAREEIGLTQMELAEKVGMRQTAVAEIEAGRIRRPTRLLEISQVLRKPQEWLLGKVADGKAPVNVLGAIYTEVSQIPVEGAIETGVMRAIDTFEDALPPAQITVARDPRFPKAKMVAFLNADRLDLANINPGDVIIGVVFDEAELPLRERMLVVTQVSTDGGKTIERTLRKVATYRDRIELQPLGTGRIFRKITIDPDYDGSRARAKDGSEVRILAVVIRVQKEIPI